MQHEKPIMWICYQTRQLHDILDLRRVNLRFISQSAIYITAILLILLLQAII